MQKLAELDYVSGSLREAVPQNIREAIDLYVEHGVRPGSFTYSVLCNNLHSAIVRADVNSLAAIRPICQYVYNAVPSSLWGSESVVEHHIRLGNGSALTQKRKVDMKPRSDVVSSRLFPGTTPGMGQSRTVTGTAKEIENDA